LDRTPKGIVSGAASSMAVRCKEMTERLKIIDDQEIEAIEAIDGGLEFELAACNLELLNKVGRPGVLVKVDHPCAQMDARVKKAAR
jgi:hypothetical protein